jgi:hypothetical protein
MSAGILFLDPIDWKVLTSINGFIHGRGEPNLIYITKLYRIRFFFHLLQVNYTKLYKLVYIYLADCVSVSDCPALVFKNWMNAPMLYTNCSQLSNSK